MVSVILRSSKTPFQGRALAVSGATSIALRATSLAIGLASTVILARLLDPAGYGTYALALSITSLLAIPIQLGLPTLIVREASLCRHAIHLPIFKGLLRWSHRLVLSMSFVIGSILALVAWIYRERFDTHFLPTLLTALPLIVIAPLTAIRQGALTGLGHVVQAQLPELLLVPVSFCAAVLGLSHLFPNLLSPQVAMTTYVMCYVVSLLWGSVLLRRYSPANLKSVAATEHGRLWLKSVVPLSLVSGFSLVNSQLTLPILGYFTGNESVGLYRVAASGAALATVIGATIGGVVSPHIATLYESRDRNALQRLARYSAWACLAPALVALIVYASVGDRMLALVFGEAFRSAHAALVILTVGQVVNCATGIVHSLLNMTGLERQTLRGAVLGTTTGVVSALLLIPKFGLLGAAVATCVAVTVENLLLYAIVRDQLHITSSVFPVGRT
jgi:O-antigen/teichoic acid export membrane protein